MRPNNDESQPPQQQTPTQTQTQIQRRHEQNHSLHHWEQDPNGDNTMETRFRMTQNDRRNVPTMQSTPSSTSTTNHNYNHNVDIIENVSIQSIPSIPSTRTSTAAARMTKTVKMARLVPTDSVTFWKSIHHQRRNHQGEQQEQQEQQEEEQGNEISPTSQDKDNIRHNIITQVQMQTPMQMQMQMQLRGRPRTRNNSEHRKSLRARSRSRSPVRRQLRLVNSEYGLRMSTPTVAANNQNYAFKIDNWRQGSESMLDTVYSIDVDVVEQADASMNLMNKPRTHLRSSSDNDEEELVLPDDTIIVNEEEQEKAEDEDEDDSTEEEEDDFDDLYGDDEEDYEEHRGIIDEIQSHLVDITRADDEQDDTNRPGPKRDMSVVSIDQDDNTNDLFKILTSAYHLDTYSTVSASSISSPPPPPQPQPTSYRNHVENSSHHGSISKLRKTSLPLAALLDSQADEHVEEQAFKDQLRTASRGASFPIKEDDNKANLPCSSSLSSTSKRPPLLSSNKASGIRAAAKMQLPSAESTATISPLSHAGSNEVNDWGSLKTSAQTSHDNLDLLRNTSQLSDAEVSTSTNQLYAVIAKESRNRRRISSKSNEVHVDEDF